ncbi:hypothetical protein DFR86_05640 [Acidianus sulfidivorans JP7]|uniref:Uncharacterized protein n=1 Tax=Acidianus sulfidivorans JP7 TaxID=619593 RepID=A0A2U9IM40_9CREN|nr:hypothetical protein [Acidianus sulfidivorans]AWR97096.1 hypothetical protein DFR86_05640 [Acidianus sulfidivorans JP7]
MKAIHNISKEARAEIIEILLENRSKKELATELGVTPAAIVKFSRGVTHASDKTIEKALDISNEKERKRIIEVIANDLVTSLIEVIREYPEIEIEKVDELRKILDEIEKTKLLVSSGFV